jgi:hypothetical protein
MSVGVECKSFFPAYFLLPFSCLILNLLNSSVAPKLTSLHPLSQHTALIYELPTCLCYHDVSSFTAVYVSFIEAHCVNEIPARMIPSAMCCPTFATKLKTCVSLWGNKERKFGPFPLPRSYMKFLARSQGYQLSRYWRRVRWKNESDGKTRHKT